MARLATFFILAILSGWLLIGMPIQAQESSGANQTGSVEIGSNITQTLEALRTLLQNTESRLEQLETRLATQDERMNQLQGEYDQLRQRVEGQLADLSESRSSQQNGIQTLQTLVIVVGVVLIGIVVVVFLVLSRRLRSLEAVPDHVGRGVEQDQSEESSQP